MRITAVALAALCAVATAEDRVADLEKENQQLEQRVRRLEGVALEKDIENYLEEAEVTPSADGTNSVLPEGMSLRVSGEIRVREEIKDGLYSPSDPNGMASFDFAHMRSRLRVDVTLTEHVSIVIEFQDVRNLGSGGSTTAVTNGVDLKRGTIVLSKIGGSRVSADIGRFVMHYGDQRVIGHLEWVDQGRTYDGVRIRWDQEKERGGWIDWFAVRVRETVMGDNDQVLAGFYSGYGILEGYAFYLDDGLGKMGEQVVGDTGFVTLGLRVHHKTEGGFDFTVEGMLQLGEVAGDGLTAYGVAMGFGYTFQSCSWKPRIGVELIYGSGDQDPTDGDLEQLQTLFPTNHLHYGYADLVGWSNIIDFRLRFSAKPAKNVTISFDYHHFRRPEDTGAWVNAGGGVIRPGAAGSDAHLGDEIDITVVWKPFNAVALLFGYSIFLPGDFVGETGADGVAHFGYVQIHVRF